MFTVSLDLLGKQDCGIGMTCSYHLEPSAAVITPRVPTYELLTFYHGWEIDGQ